MDQNEIIILGGGISGLSLAFYCARSGMQVTLIEKDQRVGGAFHSHRITESGFWLELGAHTCYNSYGNLLEIIEYCKTEERMINREKVPFRVLVNDEVRSIFSQINYPELLLSIPRMPFQKKQEQSVESYYAAILGKRNYHNLFRHFFNAVPSQKTDDFPADVLFKTRSRRKDISRSYTFKGGLESVVDGIVGLDNFRLKKGESVQSIEPQENGYRVNTEDGSQYEAANLALATPAAETGRLLQSMTPEISQLVTGIPMAAVNSAGVVVRKKWLSIEPVAGIISADDLFYSAVSRDTVYDDDFRGFTFHFKPEVTDEETRLQRISQVLGIKAEQLEQVVWKTNLLPSLKVGHKDRVEQIDAHLEQHTFLLTGNYFAGVSIEDCVSRSLREFERLQSR